MPSTKTCDYPLPIDKKLATRGLLVLVIVAAAVALVLYSDKYQSLRTSLVKSSSVAQTLVSSAEFSVVVWAVAFAFTTGSTAYKRVVDRKCVSEKQFHKTEKSDRKAIQTGLSSLLNALQPQ